MKQSLPKSLVWFYVLVTYVVIQFAWWAYHLITLSEQVYTNDEVNKRVYMIVGEGMVFFALLVIGVWQLKKSIKKEIALNRDQKNFLLATTHELKTPISVIKLYLETLSTRELNEEKKQELMQKTLKENDRLNDLIDRVLLASRVESGSHLLNFQEINLSDIVDHITDKLKNRFNNRTMVLNVDRNIIISGDSTAIESIVSNLIENALKYSESDKSVQVDLNKTSQQVIFKVTDEGKGIQDPDKVKKLFFREMNEETRTSKGSGLGLYIVDQLTQLHNGQFLIDSSNKGTVATILLPIK